MKKITKAPKRSAIPERDSIEKYLLSIGWRITMHDNEFEFNCSAAIDDLVAAKGDGYTRQMLIDAVNLTTMYWEGIKNG